MLDCPRMSHRVHTILSLLAEDHAPAALRPSILLAVDWPTVAEEAPATGDDASAAAIAHLRIQGIVASNHRATAPLAARLATVAASLTASGDKTMATHATALWGAAAALMGMPTAAANPAGWDGLINGVASLTHVLPFASRADEMLSVIMRWHAKAARIDALATKAADIIPGAKCSTPDEQATLIATALDRVREHVRDLKPAHDKALADVHALRDILGVPDGGNLVDHADALTKNLAIETARADNATREFVSIATEITGHRAENARLRAQVDRMIAAMREDAPAPAKPRPQPGDRVPWAEVEDGAIYAMETGRFRMVTHGTTGVMGGPDDPDIEPMLKGHYVGTLATDLAKNWDYPSAVLVARDLGTDPEAWRKAMREWTANGNKPCAAK